MSVVIQTSPSRTRMTPWETPKPGSLWPMTKGRNQKQGSVGSRKALGDQPIYLHTQNEKTRSAVMSRWI